LKPVLELLVASVKKDSVLYGSFEERDEAKLTTIRILMLRHNVRFWRRHNVRFWRRPHHDHDHPSTQRPVLAGGGRIMIMIIMIMIIHHPLTQRPVPAAAASWSSIILIIHHPSTSFDSSFGSGGGGIMIIHHPLTQRPVPAAAASWSSIILRHNVCFQPRPHHDDHRSKHIISQIMEPGHVLLLLDWAHHSSSPKRAWYTSSM
jgi:hypothetical protein